MRRFPVPFLARYRGSAIIALECKRHPSNLPYILSIANAQRKHATPRRLRSAIYASLTHYASVGLLLCCRKATAQILFFGFLFPQIQFFPQELESTPPISAKNTTYFCVGGVVVALLADAARGVEHGWRGKSYAR